MVTTSVHTDDIPAAKKELRRLGKHLARKEVNAILMRHTKPMADEMASESPSIRLGKMIGRTTRQNKQPTAPPIGVRVGVINNNAGLFPHFSAPALASVIEHGTDERFRKVKILGLSGNISTGEMPANPWLIPIFDKRKGQVVFKTIKSIERKIQA